MAGQSRAQPTKGLGLVVHSLSARLLLLTLLYILVSEVVIAVPSIARYHRSLLEAHIESAEMAILPFTEQAGGRLSETTRKALLGHAGAAAVILRRPDQSELFLMNGMPRRFDTTIDLRANGFASELGDAWSCLMSGGDRVLHVIDSTDIPDAETLEVIMGEADIHASLILYAERILEIGLVISISTAILVFFSLYFVFVRPMRRLTAAMIRFRDNPEDSSRIVAPSGRADEIGIAERELADMQTDLNASLQQKTRLAALGTAVARIQHDLRNMLSSAQLASDRLATLDDPVVKRLAARLVPALDRAVGLATSTLRYGRAEEHVPVRNQIALAPLAHEAAEAASSLSAEAMVFDVDPVMDVDADNEQLYRILLNLLRNAFEAAGEGGHVGLSARRDGRHVLIGIADDGPGIPETVRPRLFQPFASAARAAGSGLGLAIARDLARAHGGDVTLVRSDKSGTEFRVDIPDRETE